MLINFYRILSIFVKDTLIKHITLQGSGVQIGINGSVVQVKGTFGQGLRGTDWNQIGINSD